MEKERFTQIMNEFTEELGKTIKDAEGIPDMFKPMVANMLKMGAVKLPEELVHKLYERIAKEW